MLHFKQIGLALFKIFILYLSTLFLYAVALFFNVTGHIVLFIGIPLCFVLAILFRYIFHFRYRTLATIGILVIFLIGNVFYFPTIYLPINSGECSKEAMQIIRKNNLRNIAGCEVEKVLVNNNTAKFITIRYYLGQNCPLYCRSKDTKTVKNLVADYAGYSIECSEGDCMTGEYSGLVYGGKVVAMDNYTGASNLIWSLYGQKTAKLCTSISPDSKSISLIDNKYYWTLYFNHKNNKAVVKESLRIHEKYSSDVLESYSLNPSYCELNGTIHSPTIALDKETFQAEIKSLDDFQPMKLEQRLSQCSIKAYLSETAVCLEVVAFDFNNSEICAEIAKSESYKKANSDDRAYWDTNFCLRGLTRYKAYYNK